MKSKLSDLFWLLLLTPFFMAAAVVEMRRRLKARQLERKQPTPL